MHPEEVRLCNCFRCAAPLLGESMQLLHPEPERVRSLLPIGTRDLPFVARRISGRPMCPACLMAKRRKELAEEYGTAVA